MGLVDLPWFSLAGRASLSSESWRDQASLNSSWSEYKTTRTEGPSVCETAQTPCSSRCETARTHDVSHRDDGSSRRNSCADDVTNVSSYTVQTGDNVSETREPGDSTVASALDTELQLDAECRDTNSRSVDSAVTRSWDALSPTNGYCEDLCFFPDDSMLLSDNSMLSSDQEQDAPVAISSRDSNVSLVSVDGEASSSQGHYSTAVLCEVVPKEEPKRIYYVPSSASPSSSPSSSPSTTSKRGGIASGKKMRKSITRRFLRPFSKSKESSPSGLHEKPAAVDASKNPITSLEGEGSTPLPTTASRKDTVATDAEGDNGLHVHFKDTSHPIKFITSDEPKETTDNITTSKAVSFTQCRLSNTSSKTRADESCMGDDGFNVPICTTEDDSKECTNDKAASKTISCEKVLLSSTYPTKRDDGSTHLCSADILKTTDYFEAFEVDIDGSIQRFEKNHDHALQNLTSEGRLETTSTVGLAVPSPEEVTGEGSEKGHEHVGQNLTSAVNPARNLSTTNSAAPSSEVMEAEEHSSTSPKASLTFPANEEHSAVPTEDTSKKIDTLSLFGGLSSRKLSQLHGPASMFEKDRNKTSSISDAIADSIEVSLSGSILGKMENGGVPPAADVPPGAADVEIALSDVPIVATSTQRKEISGVITGQGEPKPSYIGKGFRGISSIGSIFSRKSLETRTNETMPSNQENIGMASQEHEVVHNPQTEFEKVHGDASLMNTFSIKSFGPAESNAQENDCCDALFLGTLSNFEYEVKENDNTQAILFADDSQNWQKPISSLELCEEKDITYEDIFGSTQRTEKPHKSISRRPRCKSQKTERRRKKPKQPASEPQQVKEQSGSREGGEEAGDGYEPTTPRSPLRVSHDENKTIEKVDDSASPKATQEALAVDVLLGTEAPIDDPSSTFLHSKGEYAEALVSVVSTLEVSSSREEPAAQPKISNARDFGVSIASKEKVDSNSIIKVMRKLGEPVHIKPIGSCKMKRAAMETAVTTSNRQANRLVINPVVAVPVRAMKSLGKPVHVKPIGRCKLNSTTKTSEVSASSLNPSRPHVASRSRGNEKVMVRAVKSLGKPVHLAPIGRHKLETATGSTLSKSKLARLRPFDGGSPIITVPVKAMKSLGKPVRMKPIGSRKMISISSSPAMANQKFAAAPVLSQPLISSFDEDVGSSSQTPDVCVVDLVVDDKDEQIESIVRDVKGISNTKAPPLITPQRLKVLEAVEEDTSVAPSDEALDSFILRVSSDSSNDPSQSTEKEVSKYMSSSVSVDSTDAIRSGEMQQMFNPPYFPETSESTPNEDKPERSESTRNIVSKCEDPRSLSDTSTEMNGCFPGKKNNSMAKSAEAKEREMGQTGDSCSSPASEPDIVPEPEISEFIKKPCSINKSRVTRSKSNVMDKGAKRRLHAHTCTKRSFARNILGLRTSTNSAGRKKSDLSFPVSRSQNPKRTRSTKVRHAGKAPREQAVVGMRRGSSDADGVARLFSETTRRKRVMDLAQETKSTGSRQHTSAVRSKQSNSQQQSMEKKEETEGTSKDVDNLKGSATRHSNRILLLHDIPQTTPKKEMKQRKGFLHRLSSSATNKDESGMNTSTTITLPPSSRLSSRATDNDVNEKHTIKTVILPPSAPKPSSSRGAPPSVEVKEVTYHRNTILKSRQSLTSKMAGLSLPPMSSNPKPTKRPMPLDETDPTRPRQRRKKHKESVNVENHMDRSSTKYTGEPVVIHTLPKSYRKKGITISFSPLPSKTAAQGPSSGRSVLGSRGPSKSALKSPDGQEAPAMIVSKDHGGSKPIKAGSPVGGVTNHTETKSTSATNNAKRTGQKGGNGSNSVIAREHDAKHEQRPEQFLIVNERNEFRSSDVTLKVNKGTPVPNRGPEKTQQLKKVTKGPANSMSGRKPTIDATIEPVVLEKKTQNEASSEQVNNRRDSSGIRNPLVQMEGFRKRRDRAQKNR